MSPSLPRVLTDELLDREFMAQVEPDWRKLLSCLQCGTCSASCPTAELMDYSPRQLWELIRLGLRDEVLNSRTFWLCTQCYACTARCPRGIMTNETMRRLREWAVANGYSVPQSLLMMRQAVNYNHNILNEDNKTRLIWSEGIEMPPERVQEPADILLFTGCVSALYPMAYSIPQSLVQIFEQAHVGYSLLGSEEWCCGYPLYSAGMKDEMVKLAQHNVEKVRAAGPKILVTTCSSCYYTWHHLYPEILGETLGFEVLHASELLSRMIQEGTIRLTETPWRVTYHDPCDLGRKSGLFDPPREIIRSIPGMHLEEMPRSRENAMCCGGGGDVAMTEPEAVEHVSVERLQEALSTNPEAIISSCQQCKRTLLQAARKTRTRIRVLDVCELVWQVMEK
jgi:heterodisulfide reductase subunit D